MKAGNAWFCINCEEVFEGAAVCPSCASRIIMALGAWLNPKPVLIEQPAIDRRMTHEEAQDLPAKTIHEFVPIKPDQIVPGPHLFPLKPDGSRMTWKEIIFLKGRFKNQNMTAAELEAAWIELEKEGVKS